MHDPKWCLFFDFHTMPACPDVGRDFDFDKITDKIKECGVDYVVFPARCNLGVAYYDTDVGIRHPSLKYDLWGKLSEACHKKGIALSAYINVGISHEEGLLHRDWTVVTPEGYAYRPPFQSSWFRNMCYNSPYAGHLLQMVGELVNGYDIDGFFFDCFSVCQCVGSECVKEMKVLGIDWNDKDARSQFAQMSQLRLMNKLSKKIKDSGKDLLVYFNGPSFADQKDAGSYLEHECLPTGGWGYDALPTYARYSRNLGKPVLNMTGRFHESWGDFGGLRTEHSLEYDCINGIANCMRTTIGDHFHPRGDINQPMFDLIRKIYGRLQKLEPWVDGAKQVVDIAVIVSKSAFQCSDPSYASSLLTAYGASRMLCELKQQFDILTPDRDFAQYKVLVLADNVTISNAMAKKIRAFLAKGGSVISTGCAGLDPECKKFALKEWGITFEGESPHDPAYMAPPVGKLAAGFPDMPLTLYERGTQIKPGKGTAVLAEIIAPYYNHGFDGEHYFGYLPPDKKTGKPAITRKGNVVHFAHPTFITYHKHAQVPMKALFGNILAELLPNPAVKIPDMPSFGRVTVTEQPGRMMVYLMSYVPEKRGAMIEMIEEPIELNNLDIAVKVGSRKVRSVYMAPDRQQLKFKTAGGGYVSFTVPNVKGYALAVIEF